MEVLEQTENKLLGRKQVIAKTTSDGSTVSRAKVKSELSKKFKVDEEQVIIKSIKSTYGSLDVSVDCDIYDKKDNIAKVESKHIIARNTAPVVEETKEEAPLAAPEPVAEENAEEPATEEEKTEEAPVEEASEEPAAKEEVKEE